MNADATNFENGHWFTLRVSVAVLAYISVRWPQKLIIFIIRKTLCLGKNITGIFCILLKTKSLLWVTVRVSSGFQTVMMIRPKHRLHHPDNHLFSSKQEHPQVRSIPKTLNLLL